MLILGVGAGLLLVLASFALVACACSRSSRISREVEEAALQAALAERQGIEAGPAPSHPVAVV